MAMLGSRLLSCCLASLVLALAGLAAASASASAPAGPRLAAVVFHVYPQAGTEVRTMGADGEAQERVVGGPESSLGPIHDTAPIWSPDGSLLAWVDGVHGQLGIYLSSADGSNTRLLPASVELPPRVFFQNPPVFAPDGDFVIAAMKLIRGHLERPFARSRNDGPPVIATALWAIPSDGAKAHPLTAWRRGRLLVPSSFAAAGTLVASVATRKGIRLATFDLASEEIRTIAGKGLEPVASPDGTRVAFLRLRTRGKTRLGQPRIVRSDLYVVPTSGGKPQLVTKVKGGARWPTWDPSGQRLALTGLGGGDGFQALDPRPGNDLLEVNADGSCQTRVFSTARGIIFGSAWQPGADRGAGPISC